MPERSQLIALALDFTSFLMAEPRIAEQVNKVILFGSTTTGEFDEESDIDIFIDVRNEQVKDAVMERLNLWRMSTRAEFWKAQGIRNELSLRIGILEKWVSLHRTIVSEGMLLYGKYIETPKGLRHFSLISLKMPKIKAKDAVKFWRKLYGYNQKVEGKVYVSKGLLVELGGIRLERGLVGVPQENNRRLIEFLRKHKVEYRTREAWIE